MIVDTNVVSEVMRGDPHGIVDRLLQEHPAASWSLAAVTVQEVTYGLARLPEGRRSSALSALWSELRHGLASRVHSVNVDDAVLAGEVLALMESRGRIIGVADAQIAATCLRTSEPLATRNVRDFEGLGIELIDPWA